MHATWDLASKKTTIPYYVHADARCTAEEESFRIEQQIIQLMIAAVLESRSNQQFNIPIRQAEHSG